MRRSFKFRIYPTKKQSEKLESTLEVCRELYNAALQEWRDAWKLNRISINFHSQKDQLPEIKQLRPELNDIHSQVLQDVLKRLDKTRKAFYSRVKRKEKAGFPRFKSKSRYNSFCYPQSGFRIDGHKLHLSKIGAVHFRQSRAIKGTIKTLTILKENGKWHAVFSCDEVPKQPLPKTSNEVGIDVGIEYFAALSTGKTFQNDRFYEKSQKKLRSLQRHKARCVKGSRRYKEAARQIHVLHVHIRNRRSDFQHKLANRLINEYDRIVIEDLSIKGLAKGFLAKQVSDAAWGAFIQKLEDKAERADRIVVKVNPSGTSQTCLCGNRVEKKLFQRWHDCPSCGYSERRDVVSAKVILQRAGSAHSAANTTH